MKEENVGLSSPTSRSVLVVEDNLPHLTILKTFATRCRHDLYIQEALSAEHALKLLEECFKPDLVLLDLNLPMMSGHELVALLKERGMLKNLNVVIFTSSSDPEELGALKDLGVAACYSKPIDLGRFFEVLKEIEQKHMGEGASCQRYFQ